VTRARVLLVAGAAAAYAVAAWMVAPGFYDGFAPPQPYNWVCPPPIVGGNLPPSSGHLEIKVINGVSDANSAFTDDGQVIIGFLPGAFDATGKTSISVDIKPVSPCPQPSGFRFSTNTYQITATAPLVKAANLVMRYSNLVADPSYVYRAASPDGPWTNIGSSQQAQLYTIDTTTKEFGYFAAGYQSNLTSPPGAVKIGGGQVLPIVVALLIVIVVVAGIPLAIMRRRRAAMAGEEEGGDEDGDDEDGDDEDEDRPSRT
jgi:hypothetical protein